MVARIARWLALAAALTACGSETSTQPSSDPAATAAKVTINAPRTSLAVGGTLQLTAEAANSAGTILVGKVINWVSSRPDVATITSQGLATGVAAGTTVVTASADGRSATVTLSVQTSNQIRLTSDGGDYIGGGASYRYTNANAIIRVSASSATVQLSIDGNEWWSGAFQVPSGSQLAPGSYPNAKRYPFQGAAAGLSWDGEGRGCNTLTGSFTIDSLSWSDGVGSPLISIDLSFEQHCEGMVPALRGTIHWRADDPTVPAGPVMPIPTNLWKAPAGAMPASGDAVYLQSEAGDYIAGGATSLFQTNISVTATAHHVSVSAGGYNGNFEAMYSLPQLTVGYYGNLQRWPFHNPTLGGLDWSGNGRGCNTLTGWFAIDRVNYVNDKLVGIDLRFEQHCEGQTPALHGEVRWGQFAT